ncbi:MAG: riboflavin synthase [Proteobacteria bacterium]|nr:riboflavin synthase [Pseudomonadota bacterium]
MFTGIIRITGEITEIKEKNHARRVVIRAALPLDEIETGASVACDGCCLTVVEKGSDWLAFDAAAETLSKTNVGQWQKGMPVNLETSLRVGDEMGGHMVSGHVDGLATVESVTPDGDAWRLKIRAPDALAPYIAPKGSVALNGISLTVNEVEGPVFGVCIIPHTWAVTNIGRWRKGDKINLEVDMLARYVARILGKEAA